MKHAFLISAMLLAILGCGKRYPGASYSKPKVGIIAQRFATVGRPWPISVVLYGWYPEGSLVVGVSAEGRIEQFLHADVAVSRAYGTRLVFGRSFYYDMKWEYEMDGMTGFLDASCGSIDGCVWDEMVSVRVTVSGVKHTAEGDLVRGKKYAENTHKVKLNCFNCVT